jgi:uncharacterized protein (DUF1330 family)
MTAPVPAYAVALLRPAALDAPVARYLERIDATLAPHGGRFLVHGAPPEVLEGTWPCAIVIIAFPDIASARAWYGSDAYQAILPLRRSHIEGDVALIEGVPEGHRATDILAG